MRVPEPLKDVDRQGATVRTLEYDDGSVIAVDFGTRGSDISVDVVDDTVILVTRNHQFEFELPEGARDVSINNGVLVITE